MTTPVAAIIGDYCDLVFRKTRSVAIVHIEIPIEKAAEFVAAFGTPSQATGVPVAIARIEPEAVRNQPRAVEGPSEHERRKFAELPFSQQASMRSREPAFWRYLHEVHNLPRGDNAVPFVRMFCGVNSRADILENTRAANKWQELEAGYQSWRTRL